MRAKQTLSPSFNLDAPLGILTTVPADSRPEMNGSSGMPKPKSLGLCFSAFAVICLVMGIAHGDFQSMGFSPMAWVLTRTSRSLLKSGTR